MRLMLWPAVLLTLGFLAVQPEADLKRAIDEADAGRLPGAETILRRILAKQPESAEANYQLGVVLFRQEKLEEAVAVLENAVRLGASARSWKALGVVHAKAGNYALAAPVFEKACWMDAREEDACYFLGRSLYALDRFEPSIAALEKALPVDKKPWRVHQGMAQALEALGRNTEAEQRFRLAMKLARSGPRPSPEDNPRLHFGVFLYRQGRAAEALEVLQQALSDEPYSSKLRYHLGRTLFQAGRIKEAAAHLEKAVQLDPSDAAAHLLLGKIYYWLGRSSEAKREMRLGDQGSRISR